MLQPVHIDQGLSGDHHLLELFKVEILLSDRQQQVEDLLVRLAQLT